MIKQVILGVLLASPALAEDRPLPVQVVTVNNAPLTLDVTLTGTLQSKDSIAAGFRNGGRITEVLVDAGNRVEAGQELARIDATQQQQAVAVSKAALAAASASQEQAKQAASRAAQLLARGVGTRASRDAADQALSEATGAVAQAQSGLDQAQRAADDTVLRAPVAAIVTQRMAEPGQVVGAAQTVLMLSGVSTMEAVFQTPDIPMLDQAEGAKVSLSPIDTPDRHMTGNVTEIAPLIDPATGSVALKVRVTDAEDDSALLGASVRGTIHLPAGTGIEIPWTALSAMGDRPAVWIVGPDDTVSLTPVTIARFQTGSVVLSDGLTPGTVIVGEGSQLLYPGRKIARAEVTQ